MMGANERSDTGRACIFMLKKKSDMLTCACMLVWDRKENKIQREDGTGALGVTIYC